jgi:hypothetical protein
MSIEYVAAIAEDDYRAFRILVTTELPQDYGMWLRVRERGKLRADGRGVSLVQIEVSPEEFGSYCKSQRRPDFSLAALDRCAREKAVMQSQRPAGFTRQVLRRYGLVRA